MIDYFTSPY